MSGSDDRARRPLIAANWKMNLGRVSDALALVRRLRPALAALRSIDVVLCPPFTVLSALSEILHPSRISLGAQAMHWEDGGAHTGEISPAMLAGLCQYVILGHSERRAQGGSATSDESVGRQVRAAIRHGIVPMVCVGESAEERERDATEEVVGGQVSAALADLEPEAAARCVVAYEPVWAIGSGRAESAAGASRTAGLTVRGTVAALYGEDVAAKVRVLYGGSVDSSNILRFMQMPELDGALVGGASLRPEFAELARRAAEARGT